MLFVDVIRTKRDGGTLSEAQIDCLVDGLTDGSLPAEQISALAMAVFLNSMTFEETGYLTRRMAASGKMVDWSDTPLDGPVIDKHSTGGIGDKVSFLLAPMAAACGCYVPMISGRGLGHSGGTLDKIASIPGYDPLPDPSRFKQVVREVGCAIIGQTADLAPADRRLYSIRDITATVESIPLITASILSKKMAAGLEGLVMDVKYGSGAFMQSPDDARALADSIIGTGKAAGLATHAVLTDMNENLGTTAGNALEVTEAVAYLTGEARDARLHDVTVALVAEMLLVGGVVDSVTAGVGRAVDSVTSGRAAEAFGRMVAAMGGPSDFVERSAHYLPIAPLVEPVFPDNPGVLIGVDGRQFGNAIIELGGGRRTIDDELSLGVGLTQVVPVGTAVGPEQPLAMLHADTRETAERAAAVLKRACQVSEETSVGRPVVLEARRAD